MAPDARSALLDPSIDFSGFITVSQAAREAHVSLTTIDKWVKRGRIRAVRDLANRRLLVRADWERERDRVVRERTAALAGIAR